MLKLLTLAAQLLSDPGAAFTVAESLDMSTTDDVWDCYTVPGRDKTHTLHVCERDCYGTDCAERVTWVVQP